MPWGPLISGVERSRSLAGGLSINFLAGTSVVRLVAFVAAPAQVAGASTVAVAAEYLAAAKVIMPITAACGLGILVWIVPLRHACLRRSWSSQWGRAPCLTPPRLYMEGGVF